MDIRCVDDEPIRGLLDIDDPVERMLLFLALLLMTHQSGDFLTVTLRRRSGERHNARGIFVIDPAASLAKHLLRALGLRSAFPAAGAINRAALPTVARSREFAGLPVGIDDVLVLGPARASSASAGG